MAERQYRTLTKRTVDRLSVSGKDAIFWDSDLPGSGVRVYPSGKKVFVVQTRAFGRSKRVSLGTHGDTNFSVDHARKKATDIIARIKTGQPPAPPEPAPDPTVADLAGRYEREYVAMHCKPLTISTGSRCASISGRPSASASSRTSSTRTSNSAQSM